MRRVAPLPYRDFYYPLNVFMHILTLEEGGVAYLHYGLYSDPDERIQTAQEHSTELLLTHLPPPSARILDVGTGLGTTLARLTALGYDAVGITPDEKQIATVRAAHPEVRVECARFEDYSADAFDAIVFQESSQYIDSDALFSHARELTLHVLVLDEFAMRPLDTPGALHSLTGFREAASRHGFAVVEETDVSDRAAPTIDYFNARLPRYRDILKRDLALTDAQVDELIESGHRYRSLYRDGTYGYRFIELRRR